MLPQFSEFSPNVRAFLAGLVSNYVARGFELCLGRTRVALVGASYAVKLPLNYAGVADNDWEGSVSNGPTQDEFEDVQYARTRLHYHGDMPILFMERIEEVSLDEVQRRLGYTPDWIGSVDCGQVGFNRHGKLKAFDYGLN